MPKLTTYYHGTTEAFNSFDNKFIGNNTDQSSLGFFFLSDKKRAYSFANEFGGDGEPRVISANLTIEKCLDFRTEQFFTKKEQASVFVEALTGEIKSGSASINWLDENIDLSDYADVFNYLHSEDALKIYKANGYDSAIGTFGINEIGKPVTEHIVFDPNQITIISHNVLCSESAVIEKSDQSLSLF